MFDILFCDTCASITEQACNKERRGGGGGGERQTDRQRDRQTETNTWFTVKAIE